MKRLWRWLFGEYRWMIIYGWGIEPTAVRMKWLFGGPPFSMFAMIGPFDSEEQARACEAELREGASK